MARLSTAAVKPSISSNPRERRRASRQPLGALGLLTEAGSEHGKQLEVLVLDVSLHGVGFRSPVEFSTNAIYTMRIGSGPLHLTSRVRIISSRDRGDGTYDVGGKFV